MIVYVLIKYHFICVTKLNCSEEHNWSCIITSHNSRDGRWKDEVRKQQDPKIPGRDSLIDINPKIASHRFY
jgi:hypothetical protein